MVSNVVVVSTRDTICSSSPSWGAVAPESAACHFIHGLLLLRRVVQDCNVSCSVLAVSRNSADMRRMPSWLTRIAMAISRAENMSN